MIENFFKKFQSKKEDAMQKRAEESRKLKDKEDKFDEVKQNLDHLIDEITSKKNHG